jgi:dTDP-4-amino-4,6-dideoxygalactose transaminase
MFIFNPDPYLLPAYRISPFSTIDISLNSALPDNNSIDDYFSERFRGKELRYTLNGREALNMALSSYNLDKGDTVTILTTSGNEYISSCVTSEISKFCEWSRNIVDTTKVIIVNHEFGYPFRGLKELMQSGIPIIEDCAHSFFLSDSDNLVGNTGDFVIYSFPKMFPLQIGGLLVSNKSAKQLKSGAENQKTLRYIKNVLSYYIGFKEEIIKTRVENYLLLNDLFGSEGFPSRFRLDDGIVPGVFMFMTQDHEIDLPELKKYYWAHGVQCSVFYGETAFFIPVHQALNKHDLQYFFEILKLFLKKHQR